MLWRVAKVPGWLEFDRGRARLFEEEQLSLQRKIGGMQPQHGGLLGNPRADDLLRTWVPAVVHTLRGTV